MLRALSTPCLLLVLAPSVSAQIVPPARDQPVDFSWTVGAYRIQSSAAPTRVEVERAMVLKVKIILDGAGPPAYHPMQDKLRIFPPAIDKDFFVEPLPDL